MTVRGFSLLELLIVLAIAGILLSIAYPTYQTTVIRARRAEGQSALLDLALRMEQYYAEHQSYLGATLGTNKTSDILASAYSPQGWYKLLITQQTESSYSLHAIPQGTQTKDQLCQTLTLNHSGAKGVMDGPAGNPKGSTSQCW